MFFHKHNTILSLSSINTISHICTIFCICVKSFQILYIIICFHAFNQFFFPNHFHICNFVCLSLSVHHYFLEENQFIPFFSLSCFMKFDTSFFLIRHCDNICYILLVYRDFFLLLLFVFTVCFCFFSLRVSLSLPTVNRDVGLFSSSSLSNAIEFQRNNIYKQWAKQWHSDTFNKSEREKIKKTEHFYMWLLLLVLLLFFLTK